MPIFAAGTHWIPLGKAMLFPDLKVVPSGNLMHLSWTSSRKPWTRTRFLEEGRTWIEGEIFRERCSELIDRVIGRLAELGVHDTLLQEEWAAIQAADPEETAFCGTAAGLGWDPYGLDDGECAAVLELDRILEGIALEEAVAAIDPENIGPSSRAIRDAAIRARHNSLPLRNLGVSSHGTCVDVEAFPVRDRTDSAHAGNGGAIAPGWRKPWEEGYHLARSMRQALGVDGKPLPTIADIADAIGEVPEELEKVTRPTDFGPATLVEGVVTRDEAGNPAFAFRAVRDDAKRFLFCRALADVLLPSGSDTLITRAGSGRQRRGRAFAAEFLAPSSALAARVSSSIVAGEEIDGLAEEFGVSPLVIEHQINNHTIARIWPDG